MSIRSTQEKPGSQSIVSEKREEMLEKDLLNEMAGAKAEIQSFQLWVDDARANRIARIRYGKAKERLRELVSEHKSLMREWLKGRLLDGKEVF